MGEEPLAIGRKDKSVKVKTIDGRGIIGCINIMGFDRLSDFLHNHNEDYLMLYNAGNNGDKTMFFVKRNIVAIEDAG